MPTRELYIVSYSRGRILKIVSVNSAHFCARSAIPDPGSLSRLTPVRYADRTMTPPTAAVSRRPRKRRAAEAVAAPAPQSSRTGRISIPTTSAARRSIINRELSWLAFNERVLAQAQDPSHPLLERVKFLAITGTNLDEFFMVRVATILKKFRAGIEEVSIDGQTTDQQLATIRSRALAQIDDQTACWSQSLRPLLAAEGIHFLEPAGLHAGHRRVARAVFQGPHLPGPDAAGVRSRATRSRISRT